MKSVCYAHISLLRLSNDSAKCHILGCEDPGMGPMIPKF